MLYSLIRPFLFTLNPETAHNLSLWSMRNLGGLIPTCCAVQCEPVNVMGLTFPNRIGLAAGLDKNGEAIDALSAFGFGHIEIGTVTPRAQPGNPHPRMFRLTRKKAIINRMGFNNSGVDTLISHVKTSRYKGILGINIGKNFDTPIERATDDYLTCLDKVYAHASYVAINISSPNTKNLRQLQGESELDDLLGQLKARQKTLAQQHGKYVPLALKIAPDLEDDQLTQIAQALLRHQIDGVIATNTTITREGVEDELHCTEMGGLSGAPLYERSTAILKKLAAQLNGQIPIIAVGGVMTAEQAVEKLQAGASLVQLYTGFIYGGPPFVKSTLEATKTFKATS